MFDFSKSPILNTIKAKAKKANKPEDLANKPKDLATRLSEAYERESSKAYLAQKQVEKGQSQIINQKMDALATRLAGAQLEAFRQFKVEAEAIAKSNSEYFDFTLGVLPLNDLMDELEEHEEEISGSYIEALEDSWYEVPESLEDLVGATDSERRFIKEAAALLKSLGLTQLQEVVHKPDSLKECPRSVIKVLVHSYKLAMIVVFDHFQKDAKAVETANWALDGLENGFGQRRVGKEEPKSTKNAEEELNRRRSTKEKGEDTKEGEETKTKTSSKDKKKRKTKTVSPQEIPDDLV